MHIWKAIKSHSECAVVTAFLRKQGGHALLEAAELRPRVAAKGGPPGVCRGAAGFSQPPLPHPPPFQ